MLCSLVKSMRELSQNSDRYTIFIQNGSFLFKLSHDEFDTILAYLVWKPTRYMLEVQLSETSLKVGIKSW